MRSIVLLTIFISTLLVVACGDRISSGGEKIAVLNWQKVVTAHPLQKKLTQGEGIYKDLVKKRRAQEELARTQMESLEKLQSLKYLSEKTYLTADFNTRMVEQQAKENAMMKKFLSEAEVEADAKIADRKEEIEREYQLKIFNLRMQLESVRMRPDKKKEIEAELKELQQEREARLGELNAEKRAYINAKMQPYTSELHKRMEAKADELQGDIARQLAASEGKYDKMMSAAPEALKNALQIMDREIAKQQDKNEQLTKSISGDIENIAAEIARERGYSIIFKEYKANVAADDITDDIIAELKKMQDK